MGFKRQKLNAFFTTRRGVLQYAPTSFVGVKALAFYYIICINIERLMNISNIKKNIFWISIGGGVVFVTALYIFAVNSFRVKNIKKVEIIENVLTKLELYERKGFKIRSEKWIQAEEAKLEMIKKLRLESEEFYKEQDRQLEKICTSVDGEEIKDEALWKNRYIQGVNVLLGKIKRRNVSFSENALPFKEWKSEIPTWEYIIPEQKRFWITEELINIILKEELKVSYLEGINYGVERFVSANAYVELCDIIPFTIKVSMDVEGLLSLINEFLKSKICFEIETVNIRRSVQKGNIQSSSTVDVVVAAYVLDFKI